MKFKSTEQALQFLFDKVADLNDRTYHLENTNFAQGTALVAILSFLSQLPPLSMEMIREIFDAEADRTEAQGADHPELAQRYAAIAAELRSIGALGPVRPKLSVIEGGREDRASD